MNFHKKIVILEFENISVDQEWAVATVQRFRGEAVTDTLTNAFSALYYRYFPS